MRLMKTIRFRPKPEFMDRFLEDYNKITEKALLKGTIDSYFTAVIEDEVVYVGIFNKKENSENVVEKGLDWLEKYRNMLQPYSDIDSITEVRFSGRVATTISRSPMVSLLRLALPASCAFSTPEMSEILFSRASPNLNPTSNLVLP